MLQIGYILRKLAGVPATRKLEFSKKVLIELLRKLCRTIQMA